MKSSVGHKRTFPTPRQIVNNALVASQQWKLWLCAFAAALVGACQFAPAWAADWFGADVAIVRLLALVGACLLLVLACTLIRCPACGLALVWQGMRRQPISQWLAWLLRVETCPRCGFSHGPFDHGE